MSGATGLMYGGAPLAMELEGVPRADWPEVMAGVQVLEYETLRILREKR